MDSSLKERIEHLRQLLMDSDDPSIGFIAPPCEHGCLPDEIPLVYQEFLRVADGAVCGEVSLYESEELLRKQSLVKSLPGGRHRWFYIGSVGEEKFLIMDVRTNAVLLVDPDEVMDPDDSLGELDYVLRTYIFGEEYKELAYDPDDDPWFALLKSHPPT